MARFLVIDGFRFNNELGDVYSKQVIEVDMANQSDAQQANYNVAIGRLSKVADDTPIKNKAAAAKAVAEDEAKKKAAADAIAAAEKAEADALAEKAKAEAGKK
jgi:glucose-1-phosphatase